MIWPRFFWIAVLLSASVSASPLVSESSVINLKMSSEFDIANVRQDFNVEYVSVNLSFVPASSPTQRVLRLETSPASSSYDTGRQFVIERPAMGHFTVSLDSVVEVSRWQPEVRKKISFPIQDLDSSLAPYTMPTSKIDSNSPEIVSAASGLAEGEDDLYSVVFRVANFTKSRISYNLSTLTADVSQNASWVLANRQGVCDEITVLFIALLRSLGIPAKFVSGIAYTDSPLFPDGWGLHGWAEVYFPGYGWVPFDVTYGEFGYIDSGHVKASEGFDPDESSVSYEWFGRGVKVVSEDLEAKASVVSSGSESEPDIRVFVRPLESTVGFGSFNVVEVSVLNLRDFYVAVELVPARVQSLELDSAPRALLLEPGGERKEYFFLRVDEDLNEGFIYTFPLSFYYGNVSASASFTAESSGEALDMEYFERQVVVPPDTKVKRSRLSLDCRADKLLYYSYEAANITCVARNSGNSYLRNLSVCLRGCHVVDLAISQNAVFSFSHPVREKRVLVTATGNSVLESAALNLKVLDVPNVSIASLEFPVEVSYDKPFNVSFLVSRSASSPYNVTVSLGGRNIREAYMDRDINVSFQFIGRELEEGVNTLLVLVSYADGNGKLYSVQEEIKISLKRLSFWQRIRRFLGL